MMMMKIMMMLNINQPSPYTGKDDNENNHHKTQEVGS